MGAVLDVGGSYRRGAGGSNSGGNGFVIFLAFICSITVIFLTSLLGSHYQEITEYEIEIPITWEIPEAEIVSSVEEKFSYMEFRSGFFSAAGAGVGGLGAVVLRVDSVEKLLLIID